VHFDWNPDKARRNLAKHRVSFELAKQFEFDTAWIEQDDDLDYGEERFRAFGFVGSKICLLVYTMRDSAIWVISLRRATRKEADEYVEYIENGR
jgi:uncharacterized DUF497 family protein